MESNRLIEVAMGDYRWAESVVGQLNDGKQLEVEIETLGRNLMDAVVSGGLSIKDLRAGVAWASALDQEAVGMYGADITIGDQRFERIARRTMHHVGRMALEAMKSSRKRIMVQVTHANKSKV